MIFWSGIRNRRGLYWLRVGRHVLCLRGPQVPRSFSERLGHERPLQLGRGWRVSYARD